MTSDGAVNMDTLPTLVSELASVAARANGKALDMEGGVAYINALHKLESFALSTGEEEWKPTPSTTSAAADIMELALQSAAREPLSCVLLQAWVAVLDALLQRASSTIIDPQPHAKRLWESAQRLVKLRTAPGSDAALASVLTFLGVILRRRQIHIECAPRGQLPSPASTPGILSRVAALQLVPLLAASALTSSGPKKAYITWPWLEYLRKAITCNVPAVCETGVRAMGTILQTGAEPEANYINDFIELLFSLAVSGNASAALENELGFSIGRLLAASQRPGGWSHFGSSMAKGSVRIMKLLFDPAKINPSSKRVLSTAVGELLAILGPTSANSVEKAIHCIFEWLLAADPQDGTSNMPDIVAGALLHWAKTARSDTFRSAILRHLIPFLDTDSSETVAYTALLCLKGVVSTVVELDEYAANLWEKLLKQVTRNKDIKKATSEVMKCVVERNEWCRRALLRHIFATCCSNNPPTGVDAYLSMMPLFTMHVQALLELPAAVLQKPCMTGVTLAAVARLSVDDSHDALADIFHWCVEYFCKLSRLLLVHQRQSLPPTITTSVRSSLRVFLGALVSSAPTAGEVRAIASAHARATVAACELLPLIEPGDTEVKLVVALLETLDDPIVPVAVPRVRGAVYRLLSRLPWGTCHDDAGKRRAVTLALDDMGEAVRLGVPCAWDEEEAEKCGTSDGANGSAVSIVKLHNVELLPCLAAVWCLDDRQCMRPTPKQALTSTVTRCAVQLIAAASAATCNAGTQSGCLLRSVLVSMRHWRQIKAEDPTVQAWNVLCCLNAVTAPTSSNLPGGNEAATIVAEDNGGEWLEFISTHWLGHEVWALRLLSAQIMARLALASGGVDTFTSSVVNQVNLSSCRISGALIALGLMHGCPNGAGADGTNKITTSGMAISFIARMLSQYGLRGDGEGAVVAASVLISLIHLSAHQRPLVETVIRTSLAPQLLLYQEPQRQTALAPMRPIVTVLLLELVTRLSLHKSVHDGSVMSVFASSVVSCAAVAAVTSTTATADVINQKNNSIITYGSAFPIVMSEKAAAAVVETVREVVEDIKQLPAHPVASTPSAHHGVGHRLAVDIAVLQKIVLQALGNTGYLSDAVSCAAAGVTVSAGRVLKPSSLMSQWLLRMAERIDGATTMESRRAWTKAMGVIVNQAWREPRERAACLHSLNLIIRGKPSQLYGTAGEEDERPNRGDMDMDDYDIETKGVSLAKAAPALELRTVSSEPQSKAAVLNVLLQVLNEEHQRVELNDDTLPQFLQLLFSAVALAEVSPCLVRPAADALYLLLRKYGYSMKDISTPLLQPWKVLLINGMVHVIERCVYYSGVGSALAEEFFASNISDDTSARRVVSALTQLFSQLGQLDVSHAEVSHGCSGRVAAAIARCSAVASSCNDSSKTQPARWPQTLQRAHDTLASPNAQAVIALLCNQIVSAITLAHGYEPPHGMVPTPLDSCTYVTPAVALELLLQLRNTSQDIDSTVSHAAGYLIVILLAIKIEETVVPRPVLSGVSLQQLRTLVPLLSPPHCETLVDTVLALLPTVLLKEVGMKEEEKMEELIEISAAAASLIQSSRGNSAFMPTEGRDEVREKRRSQVERLISMLTAETHRVLNLSLAPLTLVVHSDCSVDCVVEVLRQLDVNVLLRSEGRAAALSMHLCQRFPVEELRDMAQSSVCAFLLLLCCEESQQRLKMLETPNISPTVLARIAEAFAQSRDPKLLIEYLRPQLSCSTRVCGVFLSVCTAAKRAELQQQWRPCVEDMLLASIDAAEPQEKEMEGLYKQTQPYGDDTNKRVAFFVRSLISLSHMHGGPREAYSRYPKACSALTDHIMKNYANELRTVIQSLHEGDAGTLRELMQLRGGATQCGPGAQTTTAAAPQRLTINLSSFT
ncbi:uncharacterized protein TEOVI_000839500 [Trypanosoma equiperdum]|uniref:Uncharacterized protein n=1 Tax=Trypanosoma equiperdum TaxID=5694 RepID=A0A1G4I6I3_TRYEQ|nr:hypothetical protein, conserved [Trypanosoma equiperdum]